MAEKINVDSGNPYRDQSGHFGTSPDQKLQDSFKAIQGKKFVKKGDKGNEATIKSLESDARTKLSALRGEKPVTGRQLVSPDDLSTHLKRITSIDTKNASPDDIAYLESIQKEAEDALANNKFPENRARLAAIIGEAAFARGEIGDSPSKDAVAEPTKKKVKAPKEGNKDVAWKASGTEAEAKAFSANSEFKSTLYHGTTQTAASKITKGGFNSNKKSKLGDTNFPGTIMFTDKEEDAAWYGKRAGGDNGLVSSYSVLSMKINSAKHRKFDADSWDRFESEHKSTEDAINAVFKDNDSFEIKGTFGDTNVLIKDPKKVMVFKNDKR